MNKKKLRDRCKAIYQKMQIDGMLRQNDPVQTLFDFVLAETGRAQEHALEDSLPLVVYFKDKKDRDDFIALMAEAKPNMTSRKIQ